MTERSETLVSVVVPMLEERRHIEACLEGFARQTHPLDRLEVIVVDGGSADGSRELVEKLMVERPWLRVVDNPRRKASAAFNVGASAATGDIVCLFSAHGVPDPDYVAASVRVLAETGADGVGGDYRHEGDDRTSSAIGRAMVSPFGMASPHRFARNRQDVDTISHPAYRRSSLLAVGPFDESLERNSDYELNFRMRQAGQRLVFDPSIGSVYRPRPSLSALARQFWWYGRWKVRVIERHPGSLRPRHLVAPGATAGLFATPVLCVRPGGRRLVAGGVLAYAAAVFAAVVHAEPRRHGASPGVLAAAFPTMHVAWGAGFLASIAEDLAARAKGRP